MSIPEHVLIPMLTRVMIIPHLNPRAGRMVYRNMITNERNAILQMTLKDFITVLSRGKGINGRIIIGPKEFDRYMHWTFDLETCTQEELDKEFQRTYPKNLICDVERNLGEGSKLAAPMEAAASAIKARNAGLDAMAQMGFGKVTPPKQKEAPPIESEAPQAFDPYAAEENNSKET